jgi:hypothetical protein
MVELKRKTLIEWFAELRLPGQKNLPIPTAKLPLAKLHSNTSHQREYLVFDLATPPQLVDQSQQKLRQRRQVELSIRLRRTLPSPADGSRQDTPEIYAWSQLSQ